MSAAPPITLPTDPQAVAQTGRALIESQLAMLAELAEIGMEIARAAGRAAAAPSEDGDASGLDPALSYTRAARAVRLTIALQSKLMKDLAELDASAARARFAEASKRRNRIHREVERIVEAERGDLVETGRLSRDVWERLTDEDESAVLDYPMAEVVARICRDLGISPDRAVAAFTDPEVVGGPATELELPTSPSFSGSARESSCGSFPDRAQRAGLSLQRRRSGFPGQARE